MRDFIAVVGADRLFADRKPTSARGCDDLQVEVEAVGKATKRQLEGGGAIKEVTAVVVGHGKLQRVVLDAVEDGIGEVFVERHAARKRGAGGDARALEEAQLAPRERRAQRGQLLGAV